MTNVVAESVNTLQCLASGRRTVAVPVYQRQYRWSIDSCRQLLEDIRSVADGADHQTHFIGSILSTANSSAADEDAIELTLIDGQQRVSTLTLLIAALRDTVK